MESERDHVTFVRVICAGEGRHEVKLAVAAGKGAVVAGLVARGNSGVPGRRSPSSGYLVIISGHGGAESLHNDD